MTNTSFSTKITFPPGIRKIRMKEGVAFVPINLNLAVTFDTIGVFVWGMSTREVVCIFKNCNEKTGLRDMGYFLGFITSQVLLET